jgi:hypothetical protein
MKALVQVARAASPYLLIELLLPGGTIVALLLWLYRHRSRNVASDGEVEQAVAAPARH